MQYILMMNATGVLESTDDMEAAMQHITALVDELEASGELVSSAGLADPRQAKLVRARPDGAPEVSGDPFPEGKEFLLGYWVVECESPERAYEIAASISAIPGPGGTPANMPIEVRELATGS